jgi:hypothetical protein
LKAQRERQVEMRGKVVVVSLNSLPKQGFRGGGLVGIEEAKARG